MGAKKIVTAFFLCFGLISVIIPVKVVADNPWEIMINIPECQLYVYYNGWLFKTYKVAVGKLNSPSPTGEFRIVNKVIDPTWYPEGKPAVPPGPDNPLGKYWMGLNNKGYGIHGNSAAWSIGSPASKGCFRMDNLEIEELFSFIPIGTLVKVIYKTVQWRIDHQNQAWLEIYPDIYRRNDLEFKVQQVLAELNWDYQPHLKALTRLITLGKPLKIMIPRKIKIEVDCINIDGDGFYWNGQVYLSEDFFRNNSLAINLPNDRLFQGYLVWNPIGALEGEEHKLEWDQEKNIVSVNSLKFRINGEKIDEAARFGTKGQILINYLKISDWFDQKGLAKPVLVIDTTEGNQFSGEFIDGELWVNFETLIFQSKEFSYLWDEATWSLSIQFLNQKELESR
ncbi:MAG: L,D-transpeptidase [Bacteroidota bacterium]